MYVPLPMVMLAPLGHADEQIRRAFEQLGRGESAVLETRTTNTVGGLIPPTIGPVVPVFPRHETRLLNRLPGIAIDVPALAYLEVASTTGSAGIVAEGGAKPELVMPATQQVATARKLAAHTGISWEAYSGDYPAFVNAVQVELRKPSDACEERNCNNLLQCRFGGWPGGQWNRGSDDRPDSGCLA